MSTFYTTDSGVSPTDRAIRYVADDASRLEEKIRQKKELLADYDPSNTDSRYHLEVSNAKKFLLNILGRDTRDYDALDQAEQLVAERILTLDKFLELPKPPALLKGLADAIGVGLIYGPTGSAKSHLIAAQARAGDNGWPFLSFEWDRPGRSLFVPCEDVFGFVERWQATDEFFEQKLDADLYYPADAFSLDNELEIDRLIQSARDKGYTQIFIETLALISGRFKENDNDDMTQAIKVLYRIARESNSFVWVTHHAGHSETTRERGASALRSNVDCSLGLSKSENTVTVKVSKNKRGPQDQKFYFDLTHKNQLGNSPATFHSIPCIDPRQQTGNSSQLAKIIWDDSAAEYPDAVERWTPWKERLKAELPPENQSSNDNFTKWFEKFAGATYRQLKATSDTQPKVANTPPPKGGCWQLFGISI